MSKENFLILHVGKNEYEDYVSKALLNRSEQRKIWDSIDAAVRDEIKDYSEISLARSNIVSDRAQENDNFNKLEEEYKALSAEFNNHVKQGYKEVVEWFLGEIMRRRDSSDRAYIAIDRGRAFHKNEPVELQPYNWQNGKFEFCLSADKNLYNGVVNKTGGSLHIGPVKPGLKIAHCALILQDFPIAQISFDNCNTEKAYNDFKNVVYKKFGERVVSNESIQNLLYPEAPKVLPDQK